MDSIYSEEYWQAREERLLFAENRCEACGDSGELECHHRDGRAYKRDIEGTIGMKDLLVVCKSCHEAITSCIRERRYRAWVDPSLASIPSICRIEFPQGIVEDPSIQIERRTMQGSITYVKREDPELGMVR